MSRLSLATPSWDFPLTRPHLGILLGNADVGAMIWGEDSVLKITVGRPDVWDHNGGVDWGLNQTYAKIRATLEAKDDAGLGALFPGGGTMPTIIPIGRVEFDLGKGVSLRTATLDLSIGVATIIAAKGRKEYTIQATINLADGVLVFSWPKGLAVVTKSVPSWDSIPKQLEARSFTAPTRFQGANFGGWVQTLPRDPAFCCAWATEKELSVITVFRPKQQDDDGAIAEAESVLCHAVERGYAKSVRDSTTWWRDYWQDVPVIDIPNEGLKLLHDYGMYKFAGSSRPGATPCTLQGPWIEDYQLPPWSNDYHFNINVQMCYWPAYHGNRLEHLLPMFKMVLGWLPQLRENAKRFLGIDNGYMLPHAVDDTGRCMGNFWTGMMDHGCTMWIAEMMFRYVKYSGDKKFLKTHAFPFMKGAMNVFVAMLDENSDGTLSLPVGVSPEFRGARLDAWGRNPSFQLACAHRLAEDLTAAAEWLGEKPARTWRKILEKLPKVSIFQDTKAPIIGLWDGVKLYESHRHHSHLASIAPFDTIDCEDPKWTPIVEASFANWIWNGPGMWSGWCVPWASMLNTRVGNAPMAELWLDIWQRIFTNEGHGTLHDANVSGLSLMGRRGLDSQTPTRNEIMQLDAGLGCVAAIHEMLLHDRRGVNYLFRGAPSRWKRVSIANMLATGGVLVSAERIGGRVQTVTLTAKVAGVFKLANPFADGGYTVAPGFTGGITEASGVIELKMKKGATAVLRAL